jgi:hypothetical protein
MSNGEPAHTSASRPLPQDGRPPHSAGRRSWLVRAIMLLAVLGSVAVVLWSLFVLLFPRLRQARELSLTVARMSAEVDGLERQWAEAEAAQARSRGRQRDFDLLGGRAALESWLTHLKKEGESLGLSVRGDFGAVSTKLAGTRALAVVPVMVQVEVQPARPEVPTVSAYQRVLQLGQRLVGGDKRTDLTELTVIGSTNSISRAVLALNYWADEMRKP